MSVSFWLGDWPGEFALQLVGVAGVDKRFSGHCESRMPALWQAGFRQRGCLRGGVRVCGRAVGATCRRHRCGYGEVRRRGRRRRARALLRQADAREGGKAEERGTEWVAHAHLRRDGLGAAAEI